VSERFLEIEDELAQIEHSAVGFHLDEEIYIACRARLAPYN